MSAQWNHKIFNISREGFDSLALDIFRFQAKENEVYRHYLRSLKVDPSSIQSVEKIPFLPIRFFKTNAVQTGEFTPAIIFESSGTTQTVNSAHRLKDISLYEESFINGFTGVYGQPADWCIIGLLPAYLERQGSSLVYMVDKLIRDSNHADSGFYLHNLRELATTITRLESQKQKTLLIGVTFALLDFAEQFPMPLKHTVIMETGGMKGRRQELIRPALHDQLQTAFSTPSIHSEYGMTELLSQAYSTGNGLFHCPPWMRVLVREEDDPFAIRPSGAGTINVVDLANVYSCSFIATDDAGKITEDGFEILGRIDGSDLRGCSLLAL